MAFGEEPALGGGDGAFLTVEADFAGAEDLEVFRLGAVPTEPRVVDFGAVEGLRTLGVLRAGGLEATGALRVVLPEGRLYESTALRRVGGWVGVARRLLGEDSGLADGAGRVLLRGTTAVRPPDSVD